MNLNNKIKSLAFFCISIGIIFFASCGKNKDTLLAEKRAGLDKLQKEIAKLSLDADKLKSEIASLDSTGNAYYVDVNVDTVSAVTFTNKVELQGIVESKNTVDVTAEAGGLITSILVKQGSSVRAGQVIATLDNSTYSSQIAELKNALSLAVITYDRQSNLFKQNIGTEMQLLQAKNRVDDLKQKIYTTQSMSAKYVVKAPYSGIIDEVFLAKGEMAGPGMPLARLVNQGDNVIKIQASEKFIGSFKKGEKVIVNYPVLNLKAEEKIETVGQNIDPENRSFYIYIKPTKYLNLIKPNLLSVIEINDFEASGAITIPTKIIYKLNNERYIYIAIKNDKGQFVAKRQSIEIARSFIDKTIISNGLKANDLVISTGFQNVSEGDLLNIVE